MGWIGQGVAFAGLSVSAAWMEVNGVSATGLWVVLVVWALVTDWHPKK